VSNTRHHLTVFGASSFVGQILTRYLLERHGVGAGLDWAIAGRSKQKLEALRDSLGTRAHRLPIVLADAGDEGSLARLVEHTGCVVSTVGPYALHGEPLVRACARTGTDYCDLTGEVQWIWRMLERYEQDAKASGARIVHCCGFDSIPSDLGVYFLERQSLKRFGKPCTRVKMRVRAMRGGFSGGTVASLMNAIKEASADPAVRRQLANPYSLCPRGYAPSTRQPNVKFAEYDEDFRAWVAPFIMSAVNSRIVQRSNALLAGAYGGNFTYDEAVLSGRGVKGRLAATSMAAGLAGFLVVGALPPTRWALERFVLPAPGEGPTPEQQEQGFFDIRFKGFTDDDRGLAVKVTGDRDPGYGSTGKMLGEAATCLALDLDKQAKPGGFWTPATAFGETLVERLQAHAGLAFEVLDAA